MWNELISILAPANILSRPLACFFFNSQIFSNEGIWECTHGAANYPRKGGAYTPNYCLKLNGLNRWVYCMRSGAHPRISPKPTVAATKLVGTLRAAIMDHMQSPAQTQSIRQNTWCWRWCTTPRAGDGCNTVIVTVRFGFGLGFGRSKL